MLTDAQIIERIKKLKAEKNAVILAHNYSLGEIQDIADFCGDSLELSIKAAETKADMIVFCGVRFMAETAKILSPGKKVVLPVSSAGCDMADMVDLETVRRMKKENPGLYVVAYVNTTAETKTECDMCVTSGNALNVVKALPPDKEILFLPDRNLGTFCAAQIGRVMKLYDGYCPVHNRFTVNAIEKRKKEYPNAEVLIHPEAPPEVVALADHALSTGKILTHVRNSGKKEFIIATELGILHRLEKENPDKRFILISPEAVCPHMKLARLQDLLRALEEETEEIVLSREICEKAVIPIRRMLEFKS